MNVAVLGTGLLGSEVAIRLASEGFTVTVWNRSEARSAPLSAVGIRVADTAAGAIAAADAALLLLSDAAAIRAILLAPDAAAALAGRIVVQMGTIAPDESRAIADRCRTSGADYLEAPVLGSLPEAREGRLIVMAGGEEATFRRCLPLLEALSESPERVGDIGQGAALKLAMNQLIAGLTASFAYSLGLARSEGLDVEQFMGLLRRSALYAPTFDKKLAKYLTRDYGKANFPLRHLLKDVALFRQTAADSGMDAAPLAALESALARGVRGGLGDADYSALYEALVEPDGLGSGAEPSVPDAGDKG